MKEQINKLIEQHKEMAKEVFSLLQQLIQFDLDKLDLYEVEALKVRRIALDSEYNIRLSFISDLENLL